MQSYVMWKIEGLGVGSRNSRFFKFLKYNWCFILAQYNSVASSLDKQRVYRKSVLEALDHFAPRRSDIWNIAEDTVNMTIATHQQFKFAQCQF